MAADLRKEVAQYYDLQENPTTDIGFYRERISSADARLLEIGCGTGRVLLPLAEICAYIHGIDISEAMLKGCREKIHCSGLSPGRIGLTEGDISRFDLGQQFDLILAPYRVFQNLETDDQVHGLFGCLHRHLAPGGTVILSAFRPNASREAMLAGWVSEVEEFGGERVMAGGKRVVWYHRHARVEAEPLVFHPEFIYRLYSSGGELERETKVTIGMRCWYPRELEAVVEDHGFEIIARWGGYTGEAWGEGSELIVQFAVPRRAPFA